MNTTVMRPRMHLHDAQVYLDRVILHLQKLKGESRGELLAVLEYLSTFVSTARDEISGLGPDGRGSFASSTDELGEILDETKRAADEIMEAAESIEALACGAEPEISAALIKATTRIYEASAFQDITGQRINKVINALQQIERRLIALAEACGHAVEDGVPRAVARAPDRLLNGPQLAVNAASQDEIDRLFDS
ncbi:MAG: protein phosphatase CheZ [Rhizomicrobium sp.]